MMQFPTKHIRRRKKAMASVIENASQLGGLGKAGEALFDNNLLHAIDGNMPLPSDADTGRVNHEDVAKKILLQKYD